MKRLTYIISLILTLATTSAAYAVTDKEMEQAQRDCRTVISPLGKRWLRIS